MLRRYLPVLAFAGFTMNASAADELTLKQKITNTKSNTITASRCEIIMKTTVGRADETKLFYGMAIINAQAYIKYLMQDRIDEQQAKKQFVDWYDADRLWFASTWNNQMTTAQKQEEFNKCERYYNFFKKK